MIVVTDANQVLMFWIFKLHSLDVYSVDMCFS